MPFVKCPECGKESLAPRDLIGLEWDCPNCRTAFVVREDSGDAPPPRRDKRRSNRRNHRQARSGEYRLLLALVALVVVACVVVTAVYVIQQRNDKADRMRLLELSVEHGGIVNDLSAGDLRNPTFDYKGRMVAVPNPKLEARLREVTTEHNVILMRHPTWNIQRLDTRALNR